MSTSNNVPNAAPDEPVAQVQPILEAIAKHGPIFRRELFDAAYAAYLALDDNDVDDPTDKNKFGYLRKEARLLDIYGLPHDCPVFKKTYIQEHGDKTFLMQRSWSYVSLQCMAYRYGDACCDSLIPYSIGAMEHRPEDDRCALTTEMQSEMKVWKREWEESESCHLLSSFLESNAGTKMRRVDKIVCFALACPLSAAYGRQSYIQHLMAATVRDIFARKQDNLKPVMYTQDPVYCTAAGSFLKEHLDMEVIPDPEGFRLLDGNSFVITFAPNVPVRQIALDITHDTGGPAGLLCDRIESDGLECDGKGTYGNEEKTILFPKTDDPSPALWEYKLKSTMLEYDKGYGVESRFYAVGIYLKRVE